MSTPEEFRAQIAKAEIAATQLRGRIVRAERWDQLFAFPKEAEADFQKNLVDAWRFYYKKDDPSVRYTVESNPQGDIHRVTRGINHATTYQRLPDGNVVITFYDPDQTSSVNLITPGIGNIDHPFTSADVTSSDLEVVASLLINPSLQSDEVRLGHLTLLLNHLRGKPATKSWEDTMLYNGYMSQRIGYRLFPGYALEALAKLREEHPQFVVTP